MRSHFHHQGWLGGLPVAQLWNVLVKPMVSLRACGARPSADGQAMGTRRCGGKAGDGAKAAFLGGTHSVRPRGKALLVPRHFIAPHGWPGGRGLRATCPGQARGILPGVGGPPLRGWPAQQGWPYGGRPGDEARGGFFGGTRSPRPRCEAVRKPGHLISTTCLKDDPGA